jgi:serine O-acetyltransferase
MSILSTSSSLAFCEEWGEPDLVRPLPFWDSVIADAFAHYPVDRRRGTQWSRCFAVARIAVRSSGFHTCTLYRLSHSVHDWGGVGRLIALVLFWCIRHWSGCVISPCARLYGGLVLAHPQGIVIGPGVVVGPRSWIFQNVTLGGAPGKTGLPRIGAGVQIYAGAVIVGPVRVGDNVVIGANCVISRDVPAHQMVRVAPAITSELPPEFEGTAPST